MKIFFLILAHDHPDNAAGLARTLVRSASDAMAFIHFDARASDAEFEQLRTAVADDPRIRLVTNRAECRWGAFGLVEAPLNALAQIEAEGHEPDYVMLLSGSCLPCRPVAQLERYLEENAGTEFIEAEDESWIGNGWRSERWQYRFWFDHKTQHSAEWLSYQLQRLLRIKRSFPEGLTPRFGSQWWALTWPTLQTILKDTRENPKRLDFFRTVWIPDEMLFQSYVHSLVPEASIAGFGMTYFQFSNRGKPVVFCDDHAGYIRTLPRFFFRKIAPDAQGLRQACLALAHERDDGSSLEEIGKTRDDYELKIAAQTHFPKPGHIFYRNQYSDQPAGVLASNDAPYILLIGPEVDTAAVTHFLDPLQFTVFGDVFSPGKVDLGEGRDIYKGLRSSEAPIRDRHPALYLTRLFKRAEAVPVLTWSPLHWNDILNRILEDPNALVVTVARPATGIIDQDRESFLRRCGVGELPGTALDTMPDIDQRALWQIRFEKLTAKALALGPWLGTNMYTPETLGSNIVLPPIQEKETEVSSNHVDLDIALDASAMRALPWFSAFAGALHQALDEISPPKSKKMRVISENAG